jgi:sulfur-carrier protein adenylyltransferase/sulfurtransferase
MINEISASQLKERLNSNDTPILLDVRTKGEHSAFNIGGLNIPIDEISERLSEIEPYKDLEIVVYCRSGNRSQFAQSILNNLGYKNVKNLTFGLIRW